MPGDLRVDGVDEWSAALDARMAAVRGATDRATDDGLALIQRTAQANLSLTSHPAGTPTPSAPGSPPSLVSGALRRSVKARRTRRGPDVYAGGVGPTIVYGPAQERGAVIVPKNGPYLWWRTATGMRRATSVRLPARPFMAPAARAARAQVGRIFAQAWYKALSGR